MARKPLIEPGSLLPEAAGTDVMSRVLERDREKSGRKGPAHVEEPIPDDITSNINAHITTQEEIREYSHAETNAPAQITAQQRSKPAALKYAKQLAQTPAQPITLRLPEGLNDFLDDQAHQRRKKGVKKQDLVALGMQLLVVHLMTGGEEEL